MSRRAGITDAVLRSIAGMSGISGTTYQTNRNRVLTNAGRFCAPICEKDAPGRLFCCPAGARGEESPPIGDQLQPCDPSVHAV